MAAAARWSLVTKDESKAIHHRSLTDLTNAQSGSLSFDLMCHVAGVTLAAGMDTVLETHFCRRMSKPELAALAWVSSLR